MEALTAKGKYVKDSTERRKSLNFNEKVEGPNKKPKPKTDNSEELINRKNLIFRIGNMNKVLENSDLPQSAKFNEEYTRNDKTPSTNTEIKK